MKYEILILGEPASGKSNFLRMLAYKWTLADSAVKQIKTPSMLLDQDIFEGYVVDRTQSDYKSGTWDLKFENQEINIELPEYNGEEFLDITQHANWTIEWNERIINSKGIVLMIPVDKDEVYDLAKPCEQQVETKKFEKKDAENIVGSDFNYIRFFQQVALLKKISRKEVKKIPLVIIMNFWDKLDKTSINITPEDQLESVLPWFYNFIMCNWDKEYIQVYGASPLGSLAESLRVRDKYPEDPSKKISDVRQKFLRNLQKQSWVVTNDNPTIKNYDLSIPFIWMFKRLGN